MVEDTLERFNSRRTRKAGMTSVAVEQQRTEPRTGGCIQPAIEAAFASRVAAVSISSYDYSQEDGILIAIRADLCDGLHLS